MYNANFTGCHKGRGFCGSLSSQSRVDRGNFPRLSKHSIKSVNIYNIQCLEKYVSIKKWYIVLIQLSSFSHLLNNQSLINI